MKKAEKKKPKSAMPKYLKGIMRELKISYGFESRVTRREAYQMIGDIARIVRRIRSDEPRDSNTTCIACGGWIPREREDRRQHTCSESCQEWYRRLLRSIDAGKRCRYCGHGYKPEARESVSSVRPARSKASSRPDAPDAPEQAGNTRRMLEKEGFSVLAVDSISENGVNRV